MLEVLREAVVLEDDWVEDILEHLVRVLVASVDAAVLIIELNGAGNSLKNEKNLYIILSGQFSKNRLRYRAQWFRTSLQKGIHLRCTMHIPIKGVGIGG